MARRRVVFTSFNFHIDASLVESSIKYMGKVVENLGIDYRPLEYFYSYEQVEHWQTLDFGVNSLFEQGYDDILILDTDCIPLGRAALRYMFHQIEKGILIGTAQRSMHIENNKHVYVGSPCMGISKELFEKLGKPSFKYTSRGDTSEELSYIAEEKGLPIELLMPSKYEKDPWGGPAWELDTPDKKYGIGTTFVDKEGTEIIYHLFEGRVAPHAPLFVKKAEEEYAKL
jgi:hypothetical protein